MFFVKPMNKIAASGLDLFSSEMYTVSGEYENPDALIVRSKDLNTEELPTNLKAIARAGAGVNNIPVEKCTRRGIVVFNTPGANANSVKELVLAGILLSSRDIIQGMKWLENEDFQNEHISPVIEKPKSQFSGPEIYNKRLGVIGLGAIGVLVANGALNLGMHVQGYDPFISVEAAWGLSRNISRAKTLEHLLENSDYISIHVPLNEKTKGLVNQDFFSHINPGTRLLNFARGGLVDTESLLKAIESGKLSRYVTDFPSKEMIGQPQILSIPHLGASTPEAEENSAEMACRQVRNFLEKGSIRNSVNFPSCDIEDHGKHRIIVATRNVPNMVGQITTLLANNQINIDNLLNRHRNDYAYNIIDTDRAIQAELLEKIRQIEGIVMVRKITPNRT